MKICFILVLSIFIFVNSIAQADSSNCVKEINEQVWKPFVKHLVSGNNKGFRALHSKRVIRVLIDNNILQDYEKYFPVNKQNDTGSSDTRVSRLFELRFDKRICNGKTAWETGYYKGSVTGPGKEKRTYYGRFFVVLEKEEGAWKIIVDADTGKDASADNFNKAVPLE
jgi:Domain of unknown function (DUF4440)